MGRPQIFEFRKHPPEAVVQQYIAALNARDARIIADLLAHDCRLVDSAGGWIEGRDNALAATRAFFEFEDEFHIEQEAIALRGDEVLVRGRAKAANPQLASDKLWRARVRDGKLSYWQSYGEDALPLARILMPEQAYVPQTSETVARSDLT